jgi:hypothetical protein
MVSSSIVFDPVIDDRALQKESQKVSEEFQDPELSPSMGGSNRRRGNRRGRPEATKADLAMLGVQKRTLDFQKQSALEDTERNRILKQFTQSIGMGGGGPALPSGNAGMGGGPVKDLAESSQSMDQTLSDRLPVPVPGVSASSVLPVALAGGAGLGMLSAMKSSSAILNSVSGMFGTAMRLFFRPFGNFLGEALRPMAEDLISFAKDFSDLADSQGLAVAVASLPSRFAGSIGNAIKDVLTGDADTGDALTLGLTALTAAKLAGLLPTIGLGTIFSGMAGGTLSGLLPSIGIGSFLTGMGSGTLGGLLGSVGLGSVVAGVGSIGALIFGVASLGDLVDGDISSWNLPAKFGYALGDGFDQAWPDMAEKIRNAFTNNPVHDAGDSAGDTLRGDIPDSMGLGAPSEFAEGIEGTGLGSGFTFGVGAGGTGGIGQSAGITGRGDSGPVSIRPEGNQMNVSTDVETTAIENKLDSLQSEMQRLDSAIRSIDLMIDGQTFGELVSETQQDSVHDTNPLS